MRPNKTQAETDPAEATSAPAAEEVQPTPMMATNAGRAHQAMGPPPNSSPDAAPPSIAGSSMPGAQLASSLQRRVGNARLGRMLQDGLQAKIAVGRSGDRFEQEADEVASRVVSGQRVARISRISAGGVPASPNAHGMQARSESLAADTVDDASAESRIKHPGGGRPLPNGVRTEMEAGLGADFSAVRIHDTQSDRAEAGRLNAKAFAYRDHIWLGPDASVGDRKLMAHELTHVVQQGAGGSRVQMQEGAGGSGEDRIMSEEGEGAPAQEVRHEVVSGDTLGGLARRYGVTEEAIREANGLSGDTIRIGQVLIIPQSATGAPATVRRHEVVSGDTLGGLARRYGVTTEAIREANGLTSDSIRIGQVLVIPPTATATPTAAPTSQPGVPANFAVTTVAGVRSQAMHEYADRQLAGNWGTLGRRFRQRNEIIAQVVGLGWARAGAEQTALTNLQARWGTLTTLLADADFDPAYGTIPTDENFDAAIQAEQDDQAALSRRVFGSMNSVIGQFLTALDNYRTSRRRLDEEATEYHRMDALFANRDLLTLIAAIPHATFNAAEIKSMVSQESGDLTNTTIAGLTGKTRGLLDPTPNPGTFVGVGQHSTGARDEAIAWAASKGVTIPATPDPRTIPQESIKLSAAYLGRVVEDLLYPNLPAVKATGIELKKMAFAGYNGGPRHVYEAANAFVAGRSGINYSWDDIKNDSRISGEMRNYVSEIVWRLS